MIRATKSGETAYLNVSERQQRALDAGLTGDLTYTIGARGKPLSKEAFGNMIHEAYREAGVAGGAYGVRKTRSTIETEKHASCAKLGAMFGSRMFGLMKAAGANRWGHRDSTMLLVAFRHGLRASELVDLRWDQIEFGRAVLHVRRVKQGTPSTHPILGDELRALRRLQREQEPKSAYVFTSERGAPFSTAGFARMVERAGGEAKLDFKAHPHMLRHACGYKLANDGHDTRALQAYLGHRNIQHTVRYTELSPTRFKDFWRK